MVLLQLPVPLKCIRRQILRHWESSWPNATDGLCKSVVVCVGLFLFFLNHYYFDLDHAQKKKSVSENLQTRHARLLKTPPLSPGAFAAQKLQFPLSFARPSPQSCQSTASWELESPRRISHFSPSHGFRKNYLGWLVCDNGSVPGELNSTDMNSS